jgi:hypothetical protein
MVSHTSTTFPDANFRFRRHSGFIAIRSAKLICITPMPVPKLTYTGSVSEQPTVVYADILGFSYLVMSMAGAIGVLDGFYYSSMSLTSGLHRGQNPGAFLMFKRSVYLRRCELCLASSVRGQYEFRIAYWQKCVARPRERRRRS